MAIDTKEKRQNVPGVGRPWMRNHFPVAEPDEQWRMASGLTYGGNVLLVGIISVVHTLFGTDTQQFGLNGTDTTSFPLFGTDDGSLPLTGG